MIMMRITGSNALFSSVIRFFHFLLTMTTPFPNPHIRPQVFWYRLRDVRATECATIAAFYHNFQYLCDDDFIQWTQFTKDPRREEHLRRTFNESHLLQHPHHHRLVTGNHPFSASFCLQRMNRFNQNKCSKASFPTLLQNSLFYLPLHVI